MTARRWRVRSGARSTMRNTRTPTWRCRQQRLAHGIAETQPFIDGNKRAALVAMLTFLEINGARVKATRSRARRLDHRLQRGQTPQKVAEVLRARLSPGG